MMVVNNALFPWGVVALGVPVDSHDENTIVFKNGLDIHWVNPPPCKTEQ